MSLPWRKLLAGGLLAAGCVASAWGGAAVSLPVRYPSDPAPVPQRLGNSWHGDAELLAALPAGGLDKYRSLAVLRVHRQWAEGAYKNATATTPFEVGSLTKLLTYEMYQRAVDTQVVTPGTLVAEVLPELADAPLGQTTLAQLAAHTSGLSRWGGAQEKQADDEHYLPANTTPEELLAAARQDPLATRGIYHYSNLGYALLGQAVSRVAQQDYYSYLREQVLLPNQLRNTRLVHPGSFNPPHGVDANGRPQPSTMLGAYVPAGGGLATAMDMGRFAQHLLQVAEISPTYNEPVYRGMVVEKTSDNKIITIKTGSTRGFSSALALDLAAGIAVVVLTDSTYSVEDLARQLLLNQPAEPASERAGR